jgi:hypothetical protein
MSRYKIYKELKLAVVKFDPGIKSFQDIFNVAKEMRDLDDFSEIHYSLTDLRGSTFNFDISEINKMSKLVEDYQHVDNQILGVFLIDKPMETAYVQYFINNLKYRRDFCSTIEKAYNLLHLPITIDGFKNKLNF